MTGSQGSDIGCRTTSHHQQKPSSLDTAKVQPDGKKHTVHWFRKGLRLHDNPSLTDGLAGASTFRCVFVLDPWFAGSTNVSINKWRFVTKFDLNLALNGNECLEFFANMYDS